jgi:hypothetical protein
MTSLERDEAVAQPQWQEADSGLAVWVAAGVVLLASLAMRAGLLNAAPHFDEYYHLLAARGWIETGAPAILDGQYTRSPAYTRAVAWLFEMTGQGSLSIARLVSLLPGALLPVVVFLWVRAAAGWLAAGVAALFAIAWPQGIVESQMLRFYSTQVFLFAVGAIGVYEAAATRGAARVAWALLGAVALWGALQLQITSAIGILGILGWLVGLVLILHPAFDDRRGVALAALAGAGALVLAGLWATGALEKAWAMYRWVPEHSADARNYVLFYHHNLREQYGAFWIFFPLAALVACRVNLRLAAFCVAIFGTAVVLQSFGGMKANRYLSYALPFFFILWAMAISVMLPALVGLMRGFGWSRPVVGVLLAASLLHVAVGNGFATQALRHALGVAPNDRADWGQLAQVVGDWSAVPFRMTTHELHTVAHLGDYDLLISPSRRSELSEPEDFGLDPRTGRRVIASADALRAVAACKREGIVISSGAWWQNDPLGQALAAIFRDEGFETEARVEGPFAVLRWSDPAGRAPDCSGMPSG